MQIANRVCSYSLPLVAYLTRDFRSILYCCTGLQCVQLLLYFWLPESPRWLLTKGRYDQAEKELANVAKINKRGQLLDISKEFNTLKEQSLMTSERMTAAKKFTILDLFTSWNLARMTVMIYFIWFANSLVYYGLSLNTNDFVGDPFVNFFLLGAVEIPAYLACMYVVKRFGHKKTLLVTLVGAGIGCLAAISIDCKSTIIKLHNHFLLIVMHFAANYYVGIVFAMAGKFCVTCSFAIIYVYTGQIFPTVVRSIGVGSSSTVARIGSIIAPYIKDLVSDSQLANSRIDWICKITFSIQSEATNIAVSMVLLGVLSIVGGFFILFLREPRGVEMPDTPEDLEDGNENGN